MSDAERAAALIGTWTTEHHGRQRVVNRKDGSAHLEIEFNFIASLLYGRHMELDLQWKVENGALTHTIQHGTPAANVQRLISDFGKSCRYRMLELGQNRILLQEINDPATFHVWLRVASP
jgi:hypothetical protein